MKTTPLLLTREGISLIRCHAKDDSGGGWPFHECCYGPGLTDAMACAARNLHHNYVDVYLEIRVCEVDHADGRAHRMTTRFAHPLTLDRALSQDVRVTPLVLLNERVVCYTCVAKDAPGYEGPFHAMAKFERWSEAREWVAQHQHHPYIKVDALVDMQSDRYDQAGLCDWHSHRMRCVIVMEQDLCAAVASVSL